MIRSGFVHLAFLFELVDLVFGLARVHAEEVGMDASKAEHEIDKLKQKGEVYEPRTDHLRTT